MSQVDRVAPIKLSKDITKTIGRTNGEYNLIK